MKKQLMIVSLLILLSGLAGCGRAEEQEVSEQSTLTEEEVSTAKEEEKVELEADVVVIGAGKEGLTTALSAANQGAESVLVLYLQGEDTDEALLEQAKENPVITLYPDTLAKSLIMDAEGKIQTIRAVRDTQVFVVQCGAVIVAVDPIEETYSMLLSFLSKCEHGNLLVDDEGRGLRNTNLSQDAPTKCGVPLTTVDESSGKEEAVLSVVEGLYGVGTALCENFEPPAIEDIARAAVDLE